MAESGIAQVATRSISNPSIGSKRRSSCWWESSSGFAPTARGSDENTRDSRASSKPRARAGDSEGSSAEITALREERDLIRSRVDDMLKQIEA